MLEGPAKEVARVLLSAPRFALPETVAEAVAALADRPDAVVVAGGTEVMPDLLWRRRTAAGFVSLRRVPALRAVTVVPAGHPPAPATAAPGAAGPDAAGPGAGGPGAAGAERGDAGPGGWLTIGAGVTAVGLAGVPVPGLVRAAASLGSPLVRAEATLGGNIVSALPYRNLLPVLLALDARLTLESAAGRREVPFDGFVRAPGVTGLRPGELVTAVTVPVRPGFQDYVKVGRRNAQFVATVSAAVVVSGTRVRLAYGNAGPVPFRSDAVDAAASAALAGGADLDAVAALVRAEVDPPQDDAASAAYRRHALGVLTVRLLERCAGG
jgi:CO/xanthine dehydrogenase FAD-binding subunit